MTTINTFLIILFEISNFILVNTEGPLYPGSMTGESRTNWEVLYEIMHVHSLDLVSRMLFQGSHYFYWGSDVNTHLAYLVSDVNTHLTLS